LHVVPPGDGLWQRRFADVLGQIIADIGGPDGLSEGQRQLARRCATIALECEKLESRAVAGEQINLDMYGQMTDRLGRAFHRLGLRRVARDAMTLADYLATKAPPEPQDAADDGVPAEILPPLEEPAGEPLQDG
jgi:hypothetical protein